MTKEYAKELIEKYKGGPDDQVLNLISTEGGWTSLDKTIGNNAAVIVETFTMKQLKEIAND